MQIPINETFRIESDSRNWSLQKYKGLNKDGAEIWDGIAHHNTLPRALESYFEYRTKTSDAKTIQDAKAEFQRYHKEVKALVERLDFKASEMA